MQIIFAYCTKMDRFCAKRHKKKRTIKDFLTVRFENQPLIVRRTGVLRWKAFLSRS